MRAYSLKQNNLLRRNYKIVLLFFNFYILNNHYQAAADLNCSDSVDPDIAVVED